MAYRYVTRHTRWQHARSMATLYTRSMQCAYALAAVTVLGLLGCGALFVVRMAFNLATH